MRGVLCRAAPVVSFGRIANVIGRSALAECRPCLCGYQFAARKGTRLPNMTRVAQTLSPRNTVLPAESPRWDRFGSGEITPLIRVCFALIFPRFYQLKLREINVILYTWTAPCVCSRMFQFPAIDKPCPRHPSDRPPTILACLKRESPVDLSFDSSLHLIMDAVISQDEQRLGGNGRMDIRSMAEAPATGAGNIAADLPGGLVAASAAVDDVIAGGKKLAFFLDYDGTLSHIVNNPQEACLAPTIEGTLEELKKNYFTSIITGRKRETIQKFVPLKGLSFGCSHGVDIFGPSIKPFCAAKDFLHLLKGTLASLLEVTKKVPGAHVEDNEFSLTVHYRMVKEEDRAPLLVSVNALIDEANSSGDNKLFMGFGNNVWEIKPDNQWNKGSAVQYVMQTLGKEAVPIFIGDDLTDENGFRAVKEFNGIGIIVFNPAKHIGDQQPRDTQASIRLDDPDEVGQFLAECVRKGEGVSMSDVKTAS